MDISSLRSLRILKVYLEKNLYMGICRRMLVPGLSFPVDDRRNITGAMMITRKQINEYMFVARDRPPAENHRVIRSIQGRVFVRKTIANERPTLKRVNILFRDGNGPS